MLEVILGFVIGFVSSIPPMGPIAIIVLRRGLLQRYREGLAIAIGSALAEAIYALLAVFGLDALLSAYPDISLFFRWLGVFVLAALGLYFALTRPHQTEMDDTKSTRSASAFVLGLSIALFNPTLPVTWTTGVGMLVSVPGVEFVLWSKLVFPLAVCAGISAWFAVLLAILRRWGSELEEKIVESVVRILGVILLVVAAWYAHYILTGT